MSEKYRQQRPEINGKPYVGTAAGSGLHYVREGYAAFRDTLRRADLSYDKDGVLTDNARSLHESDRKSFDHFARESKDPAIKYTIKNPETRGWLEALKGYSASAAPYEAVMAVNKWLSDKTIDHNSIRTAEQKFAAIRIEDKPVIELEHLKNKYLTVEDRAIARAIHELRAGHIYRTEEMASHITEIPGATRSLMEVVRAPGERKIGIYTNAETQALTRWHFEASFRDAGHSEADLAYLYSRVKVITAEDVTHPKPHPEGLTMLLNGKPLIHIGDGHSDARTIEEAKTKGINGVEFIAIVPKSKQDEFIGYQPLAMASHIGAIAEALRD